MSRLLYTALVAVTAMACARGQHGATVPPSSHCPPPGTLVPFAQLVAQTRDFVGCDVRTRVAYVGAGAGAAVLPYNLNGYTLFRVLPPGQGPSTNALGGLDVNYAALRDEAAGPMFNLAAGAVIELRGRMEYRSAGALWIRVDTGSMSRLFRASTMQLATATPTPEVTTVGPVATSSRVVRCPPPPPPLPPPPRVAVLVEAEDDAAAIELVLRDSAGAAGAVVLPAGSVLGARGFVGGPGPLSPAQGAALRERLDVDRLVVADVVRARHRAASLQLFAIGREGAPWSASDQVPRPEIVSRVMALAQTMPPLRAPVQPVAPAPVEAAPPEPAAPVVVQAPVADETPMVARASEAPEPERARTRIAFLPMLRVPLGGGFGVRFDIPLTRTLRALRSNPFLSLGLAVLYHDDYRYDSEPVLRLPVPVAFGWRFRFGVVDIAPSVGVLFEPALVDTKPGIAFGAVLGFEAGFALGETARVVLGLDVPTYFAGTGGKTGMWESPAAALLHLGIALH